MARYVLPVVGAVVGYWVGGPRGAMWGWQLGAAAGSIVDPQVIKGPSIGDLVQQTSQAGVPRPIVFGRSQPFSGNVIASSEPRIVKRTEGGKGGPEVETESVFRTYAIRICEGPVDGILRIWRNNTLVYDARTDSDLSAEDNAKFLERARFFLGDYDQMPSPDLEAIFGVGTTPAHRGTCYMVMADEDLTDFRGAIPQWQFQVARGTRVGVLSNSVLYPWLPTAANPVNPFNTNVFTVSATGNNSNWSETNSYPTSLFEDFDSEEAALAAIQDAMGGRVYAFYVGYSANPGSAPDGWLTVADPPGFLVDGVEPRHVWLTFSMVEPTVVLGNAGSPGSGSTYLRDNGIATNVIYLDGYFSTGDLAFGNVFAYSLNETPEYPYQFAVSMGSGEFAWACSTAVIKVVRSPGPPSANADLVSGTFKVLQTHDNVNRKPLNPCLSSDDPDYDSQDYWEAAYADAVESGDMEAGLTYGVDYPTEQDWAYFYYDSVIETTIPVVDIIDELCERVGLTQYDTSELEDLNCWGLTITNQYPVYTAFQALGQVFMFDGANIDGTVKFVIRGGDTVATVTSDDLVDDHDLDFETTERQDSIAVPRVVHLNYFDVEGGLATDKQSSERPGDRRSVGESSLSSAVIMEADQAAQVVTIQHKVAIEELRGERRFSLSDEFIGITVSDNILIEWDGATYRMRISACEVMDGYQQYTAVHDRQSNYTSDVEGIPASPQTPPPSSVVGPTMLEPLDIHILRDADDAQGLIGYIAVAGAYPAWQGARVELSYDSGANYVEQIDISTAAVMGTLSSALNDHPQAYPDETNTFSVSIYTSEGELQSTDLTGMLNGDNLAIVGNELIQFATVDETSEGEWDVSYLLRGRKGSTTAEHAIGERFVLLDRNALATIPARLTDIGRSLTLRATSFGTSTDTATTEVITYQGISQTERAPAYLQVYRNGDTLTCSWQGVGRIGSGAQVAQGQRFTGYRVTFDDGSDTIVVNTTDQSLTQDVSSLASPVTVSVEQINSLTGAGPFIEVIA